MNIAIIGYGAIGKHYIEQLKKFKNINKIYIIENNIIKNLDKNIQL